MAIRQSLPRALALVALLSWPSSANARARPGEQPTHPPGPPANLHSGAFATLVEQMWRESETFRQQCQRLGEERELTIKVLADASRARGPIRAWTELSRKNGSAMLARVIIHVPADAIELIAHELEHVIEQIDGAGATGVRVTTTHASGAAYESQRAMEAGKLVAREVTEYRGSVVATVAQHEPATGLVDPASASVSANGLFVAFTSAARLVPDDKDDEPDLYVLDLARGTTSLESASPGWSSRFKPILYPRISGDGRLVVFQAVVEDGLLSSPWQVVVLDRRLRTARIVSAADDGQLANGHCTQARISADGTTVVFDSLATNLVAGDDANGKVSDIYAATLATGTLTRVSVATNGAQPRNGHAVTPTVSADGRYIAFASTADLGCATAACEAAPSGRVRQPQVYRRDMLTHTTVLISRGHDGKAANGASTWPSISDDGQSVAFVSEASNVVRGDGNRAADVFLHDTSSSETVLVSRRPDGKPASGASGLPAVSGDGGAIVFQSVAPDMLCIDACQGITPDINLLADVFVYDRSSNTTVRASADGTSEWMASSHAASIDAGGTVVAFASRRSSQARLSKDDNLFIWKRKHQALRPSTPD